MIFDKDCKKEMTTFDETITILLSIIDKYNKFSNIIKKGRHLITNISNHEFSNENCAPCILIKNILIKICINNIIYNSNKDEDSKIGIFEQIFVYSINADPIIEVLTEIIKVLVDCCSKEILMSFNVKKIIVLNDMLSTCICDSYELTLLEKSI